MTAPEAQLCLSCGERPANLKNKKTLPLCDECAALASDSRGVQLERGHEVSNDGLHPKISV